MQTSRGGTELKAVEVKIICPHMIRPSIPRELLKSLGQLELADQYTSDREITVDILIGLDMYWKFMKQGFLQLLDGLVAQDTTFGWVLSGSCSETPANKSGIPSSHSLSMVMVSQQLLNLSDIPDATHHIFLKQLFQRLGFRIHWCCM
jgi:hypothetical protein